MITVTGTIYSTEKTPILSMSFSSLSVFDPSCFMTVRILMRLKSPSIRIQFSASCDYFQAYSFQYTISTNQYNVFLYIPQFECLTLFGACFCLFVSRHSLKVGYLQLLEVANFNFKKRNSYSKLSQSFLFLECRTPEKRECPVLLRF